MFADKKLDPPEGNLMPKCCLYLLLLMLVLSLPLLAKLESEAVLEYFTDRFERHTFDVRVEEHNKQPADEADATVKAESS